MISFSLCLTSGQLRLLMQRSRPEILHGLRAQPPQIIGLALDLELKSRRPRKLLLPRLQARLALALAEDSLDTMTPDEAARGAPKGNQNAAKEDGLDATLTIRIKQSERDAWMAAKGKRADGKPASLALWVRRNNNIAAGIPPPDEE